MELRSLLHRGPTALPSINTPCTSSPCLFHGATRQTPGDPDANVEFVSVLLAYEHIDSNGVMLERRRLGAWCLTTRLVGVVGDNCGTEYSVRLETANGPLVDCVWYGYWTSEICVHL